MQIKHKFQLFKSTVCFLSGAIKDTIVVLCSSCLLFVQTITSAFNAYCGATSLRMHTDQRTRGSFHSFHIQSSENLTALAKIVLENYCTLFHLCHEVFSAFTCHIGSVVYNKAASVFADNRNIKTGAGIL